MSIEPGSVASTHDRARAAREDAVARSRLRTGVWIARLLAGIYVLGGALLLVLPGPDMPRWPAAMAAGLLALGLFLASSFLERGSRVAAVALLTITLAGTVASLRGGRAGLLGILFNLGALAAFANALRGTLALARSRREARLADHPPRGNRHDAPG